MTWMDLNCDMGEVPEAIADGTQEALLRYVTSANIACGAHAGDPQTMRATIEQALRCNVAIGAHPGYEDRADFGRRELKLTLEEISTSVYRQVCALAEIANDLGAHIGHVKPHGALYNQAVRDPGISMAIAEGVRRWNRTVILMGLAGSPMLDVFYSAGFDIAAEAFADRRYEADGSLRSRKFPDALLKNPEDAAAQALRIVEQQNVIAANGAIVPLHAQTICIHGDTPGALRIAEAVNRALRGAGVSLRAVSAKT
jgi:5-oxoprolinase (ATP-hydrolysing) subunit A